MEQRYVYVNPQFIYSIVFIFYTNLIYYYIDINLIDGMGNVVEKDEELEFKVTR